MLNRLWKCFRRQITDDEVMPWDDDYALYVKGESHRKIDPFNPTVWVPCKGTPWAIQKEVKKFKRTFKDILEADRRQMDLKITFRKLSHNALTVSAEWRTFFRNEKLIPGFIRDKELQEIADSAYNQWQNFMAAIYELFYCQYRSRKNSFLAIRGFIDDQFNAIHDLKKYYRERPQLT